MKNNNYTKSYPFNRIFSVPLSIYVYSCLSFPLKESLDKEQKIAGMTMITSQEGSIHFFSNELPMLKNNNLKKHYELLTCNLITNCYEILKEHNLLEFNEISEFLRHLRNAATHNKKFGVNKISSPVKWRNKEINTDLDGIFLFDFLEMGDVLLLIQDLEKDLNLEENWEKTELENPYVKAFVEYTEDNNL